MGLFDADPAMEPDANPATGAKSRPRYRQGQTYQVPVEIRPERRLSLSIRWLVGYARDRGEKTMMQKLSSELLDAELAHERAALARTEALAALRLAAAALERAVGR